MLLNYGLGNTSTRTSNNSQPVDSLLIEKSRRRGPGSSCSRKNLLELQDLSLGDQHPVLPMASSIVTKTVRRMNERLTKDLEAEPKGRDAASAPVPKCFDTYPVNRSRCISHGQVFGAVGGDIGVDLFHASDSAQLLRESNSESPATTEDLFTTPVIKQTASTNKGGRALMRNTRLVNTGLTSPTPQGLGKGENPMPDLPKRLENKSRALLVSEVAELLQVSERQIYKLASERRIPSLKIAGCIRFDGVVLASWLRRNAGGVL